MKQLIFVFILLTSCLACANNRAGQTEKKEDMKSTKEIYLAGGCFRYVPELPILQKP